jgi:hypothetical protein
VAANPPPEAHRPLRGEKEYRDFLIQTLGAASLCLALLVCFLASFPMDLAEELAFTDEEVMGFSEPGSRLLAKAKLPEKVRVGIISSGDYVGLTTIAVAYVSRIMQAVKERTQNGVISRQASAVQSPQPNGAYAEQPTNGIAHLAGFGSFAVQ